METMALTKIEQVIQTLLHKGSVNVEGVNLKDKMTKLDQILSIIKERSFREVEVIISNGSICIA